MAKRTDSDKFMEDVNEDLLQRRERKLRDRVLGLQRRLKRKRAEEEEAQAKVDQLQIRQQQIKEENRQLEL